MCTSGLLFLKKEEEFEGLDINWNYVERVTSNYEYPYYLSVYLISDKKTNCLTTD